MFKRDVVPKEILEVEVFSDKLTTRVYDWQLRDDDNFYQYDIENKSKIKIHSRLMDDPQATFVIQLVDFGNSGFFSNYLVK